MKSIFCRFMEEGPEKGPLALATIIDVKGSSPQVPGASALFSSTGLLYGTLGGGMLEADAQERALLALEKRSSVLMEYDLGGEMSSEMAPICGGEVSILIDACPDTQAIGSVCESIQSRRSGVLVTGVKADGEQGISIARKWIVKAKIFGPEAEQNVPFCREEIKNSFATGKPALLCLNEDRAVEFFQADQLYLEPVFPFCQLLVAGAGHVGRAVAHLGSLLDFEVTVIDDRPEFASPANVPEADRVVVDDIGRTVQNFSITGDVYIVIVTRGHSHDAEVLRACIGSRAAYIGMIGSDRKIKLMRQSFLDKGWATQEQFDRVYAPIGLDIQSKTVEEIAVSIAAQLVLVRNQVQGRKDGSL